MSSRLLQDFRSLEPRNWEELAAAAKFLAGVYKETFHAEALALAAAHMPAIEQLAASFLARHHASLYDQAYAIHLGARAASTMAVPVSFAAGRISSRGSPKPGEAAPSSTAS